MQNGWTPLHWAVANGHFACAKLLLERGTDQTVTDKVPARLRACSRARVLTRSCARQYRKTPLDYCQSKLDKKVLSRIVANRPGAFLLFC
jgi:ankyrin repeat protein